jgi:hypothetical protein
MSQGISQRPCRRSHVIPISLLRATLIASFLAPRAIAAQPVEGHVVNAATGAGIPGVSVRLFPAGDSPGRLSETGKVYSTTTDSEGRFRIEGVEDGAYSPRYVATGFAPIPEPGNLAPAFPVVAGGDAVRLEIKMQPLGRLSGRVLDATGKPVPNAGLWLVGESKWCMPPICSPRRSQAKTNEKGQYSIADLDSGPWLISAAAPSSWEPPGSLDDTSLGWAQTFYPGETDPQLAQAIMVRPGSEQWNLDIQLAALPVHRVRGRVLDARGNPVQKAAVALGKGFGPDLTQETSSDGAFEFAAVVDDEWRLSAAANQNQVNLWGVQSIEIKRHDLENVELRLTAPFTLRGKIVMAVPEGTQAPQPPPIDLILVSGTELMSDRRGGDIRVVSDGGDLKSRDIYPGTYRIDTLTDSPVPYYLDSIRLGDQDALGWVSILSDAQPLILTYKLGGGTVRGTIEGCGAADVLLIPQDPKIRRHTFLRVTTCGQNGQFEFLAVRPGEYYGLAITGDRSAAVLQDGALLKQATRVTVNANEAVSADIRVIVR